MAALLNSIEEQLLDKNQQPLKAGATATHDFLGDCLLRGNVPIAGDGVNMKVDCLGPDHAAGKPASVGVEHLGCSSSGRP